MPGCSVERMNWKPICRRELGHRERITVIWSIIYRGQFTNDLGGIYAGARRRASLFRSVSRSDCKAVRFARATIGHEANACERGIR